SWLPRDAGRRWRRRNGAAGSASCSRRPASSSTEGIQSTGCSRRSTGPGGWSARWRSWSPGSRLATCGARIIWATPKRMWLSASTASGSRCTPAAANWRWTRGSTSGAPRSRRRRRAGCFRRSRRRCPRSRRRRTVTLSAGLSPASSAPAGPDPCLLLADLLDPPVDDVDVLGVLGYRPNCRRQFEARRAGLPIPAPCGQCPQELFHAATEWDVLYGGASYGGKTKALLMEGVKACRRHPGLAALAIRENY